MKILIVSYFPMNQMTPRAFRAKSLYETFVRQGHEVVFISSHDSTSNKVKTVPIDNYNYVTKKLRNAISLMLNCSLPDGKNFFKATRLLNKINHKNIDLTISIGLPFSTHLMTAIAVKVGKLKTTKLIADYGDPYSKNPSSLKPFYATALERWTLATFDKITIPTESAATAYKEIITKDKIEVIPQGRNINQDFTSNYIKNQVPNFCFAGNLYKKIRNPKLFLDLLTTINKDFIFHIYTDFQNTETMEILTHYKEKLNNRLVLRSQIPRQLCIETMSRMDFLINFSNQSTIQTPSKIIDYALSSRPFLDISQDQDNFEEFYKYLDLDFSSFIKPDISKFDENLISKKFLRLF